MDRALIPPIIFVTGIGTGVGKTLVSAVLCEALQADYWKPIQSGLDEPTDTEQICSLISSPFDRIHPETYQLRTPVSPHEAARLDQVEIEPERILQDFQQYACSKRPLVIEGAGGLLVPLCPGYFFADLIIQLRVPVVVVSSRYLGSINHSLLTADVLRTRNIPVWGWVFNRSNGDYDDQIVQWTGIRNLISIRDEDPIGASTVRHYATRLRKNLQETESQLHPNG